MPIWDNQDLDFDVARPLDIAFDEDPVVGETLPGFVLTSYQRTGELFSVVHNAHSAPATAGGRLQWACLAHLSEQNNHPDVALHTHREIIGEGLPLFTASRYRVSEVMYV